VVVVVVLDLVSWMRPTAKRGPAEAPECRVPAEAGACLRSFAGMHEHFGCKSHLARGSRQRGRVRAARFPLSSRPSSVSLGTTRVEADNDIRNGTLRIFAGSGGV
jgi:hypothetical protein